MLASGTTLTKSCVSLPCESCGFYCSLAGNGAKDPCSESSGSASSHKTGCQNKSSSLEVAPVAAFHYKDVRMSVVALCTHFCGLFIVLVVFPKTASLNLAFLFLFPSLSLSLPLIFFSLFPFCAFTFVTECLHFFHFSRPQLLTGEAVINFNTESWLAGSRAMAVAGALTTHFGHRSWHGCPSPWVVHSALVDTTSTVALEFKVRFASRNKLDKLQFPDRVGASMKCALFVRIEPLDPICGLPCAAHGVVRFEWACAQEEVASYVLRVALALSGSKSCEVMTRFLSRHFKDEDKEYGSSPVAMYVFAKEYEKVAVVPPGGVAPGKAVVKEMHPFIVMKSGFKEVLRCVHRGGGGKGDGASGGGEAIVFGRKVAGI